MGRGKMKMDLIEKPGARILTFRKRKVGLTKKLEQITTLCAIRACMIIYEPSNRQSFSWPPNDPTKVGSVIETYLAKNAEDSAAVKRTGVADFLEEKKKKVEEDLVKQRKINFEAKYPSLNNLLMNSMSPAQLKDFAAVLYRKAQKVRSRIHQITRMREIHEFDIMKKAMMLRNNPAYNNYNQLIHYSTATAVSTDHRQFHYPTATTDYNHVGGSSVNMIVPQSYFFGGGGAPPPAPLQAANNPYMNTANIHGQQAQYYGNTDMAAYAYSNMVPYSPEEQKLVVNYGGGDDGNIGDHMNQFLLYYPPADY